MSHAAELPTFSPPQFPQFPMPPMPQAGVHSAVADVVHQLASEVVESVSTPHESRMTERERVAEEAIRSSIQHVIHEYVRQDIAERMHEGEEPEDTLTASGKRPLQCHVGNPQHTWRLGALLAIAFFGMATLFNFFSVTVLVVGCTLVYVSDSLGYQKGSILVLIFSLAAFSAAIVLSNLHALTSAGPLLLLLNTVVGLMTVAAATAVVHYRWLQVEFSLVVHMCERLSVAIGPIVSLPSMFSICVAFVSAKHAPLVFALVMCLLHRHFYCRLRSSFLFETVKKRRIQSSNEDAEEQVQEDEEQVPLVISGRDEAIIFTLATLLLPTIVYLVVQSNWDVANMTLHVMNVMACVGVPVLYLFWDPRNSLWFLKTRFGGVSSAALASDLKNDPLGIWDVVVRTRSTVLAAGYMLVLHWIVYRLLHSRYQYLFVGAPPPFNGVLLLLAAYALTGVVVLARKILSEPASASSTDRAAVEKRRFALDRITVMLLSVAFSLLLAAAAGMPQFFYPMSALTASSFNAYLLDRRNTSNYTLFCCCSSLLLMWWMYRTFSFIVMDLHVLGEAATVPTPVVAVSVLWTYLMGCIAFGLSFSENKRPMHFVMFLHALKLAWVEHVLYSQKEVGSYPGVFVFVTSGIGLWLCVKLYRNEVMDTAAASVVAAAYVAKVFTFLAEVCGAYYAENSSQAGNVRRAVEVAAGWWGAFLVAQVGVQLELLKREEKLEGEKMRSACISLIIGAAVVALTTIENVQRAAAEFITQQYLTASSSMHASIGMSMMIFGLCTAPIFVRHASAASPGLQRLGDLCKSAVLVGLTLFVVRPSELVVPSRDTADVDVEIMHHETGRLLALSGLIMAVIARFLPLLRTPLFVRILYWFISVTLMSVGLTVVLIPAATFVLSLSITCFIFFTVMTIDVCHYRQLHHSEAWIVYGVSVVTMVLSFVLLGRVNLQKHAGNNLLLIWEMHETGRMTLLAVAACTNLFTAVLLKFRLSGKSLLPSPVPLTHEMVQQIGVIGNYTTLLTVVIMTILNLWAGDASPMIFIASSLILLLLVDDEMLFFELSRESYRYLPVLTYIVFVLWGTHLYDAFELYSTKQQIKPAFYFVLSAIPLLPSHVSLISVLWWGRHRGGVRVAAVLLFVVIDLLCLLLTSRRIVQWMALVGVAGQLCRLYEAQFWKRKGDTVL